jgi:hypothetical protein
MGNPQMTQITVMNPAMTLDRRSGRLFSIVFLFNNKSNGLPAH